MEMSEEEWKECVKKHGFGFSDGEEDSDTESKLVLDNLYEAFKPPPILIDPEKHKIIEIGGYDSDDTATCTDFSEKSETTNKEKRQKLTKSQKKRRRRRLLKENSHKITDEEINNCRVTVVSKNKSECCVNKNKNKKDNNERLKQDTPKIEHIATDVASSSSEFEEKPPLPNGTSALNNNPTTHISAYQMQQNFLCTMDIMLRQLHIIINTNPTDSLNIFSNVQLCLKTVENFGVHRKPIKCVAVLITETAARFKKFLNNVQSNGQAGIPFQVNEFFYDMNTIILVTVTKHHGFNLPEVMNTLENLVFVSFNNVLTNLCEKMVSIIYHVTGIASRSPFKHFVLYPGTVWESYYDMLHFINLAKSIQHSRINSEKGQVVRSVCEKPPSVVVPQGSTKSFLSERSTVQSSPQCQSQLDPILVDDLTINRRFMYDGSFSGSNFQNLYSNKKLLHVDSSCNTIAKTKRTTVLDISSFAQLCPPDNLTRSGSYLRPNFQFRNDFQNVYHFLPVLEVPVKMLNQVQSRKLVNENLIQSRNKMRPEDDQDLASSEKLQQSLGVSAIFKELSPIEVPLSWAMTTCDFRILITSVIFLLFFRKILYCVFVVFSCIDIFMLILLLLYFCTYFVIKF
ncbi:uncharacterized protein LOC135134162 [Zophobas morio]|uniref:uncharacterized protein LOC135134162 n=1 Tax=Zophobas morio TaxID=2755281 RepID=UPI0030828FA6